MSKQDLRFEATAIFTLSYDPKSKAFKEAWKSYSTHIEKGADAESMLKHVCFHINRFGIESMVEGVGYVKKLGDKTKPQEPFSGISIKDPEPDFNFERW